ncbi:tetratricopeptide repeat protein [Actinokineospora enzanensis]|uniref:tetratricopeptide repeat protein n=1 Tax=Actinokineospora enzanensis TaxID=155975 RepID=UPI00036ED231|nr:hypothetical protein [Actinokineospora enzanensis]
MPSDGVSAPADEVLRCLDDLRVGLPVPLLAALVRLPPQTTADLVASLDVESPRPGWVRAAPTRPPVRGDARARLVDHLLTLDLTPDWVTAHRDVVAAALDATDGQAVCALARSLWRVTAGSPLAVDAEWRSTLMVAGERAARTWGNRVALAVLLDRSGRVAAAVGDDLVAESQFVRALELWHDLADEPHVIATLTALVSLFRQGRRWHRALDAAFELLAEHRRRGSDVAAAATLGLLGDLMIAAGRADSGVHYLEQADAAFDAAPDAVHVDVLLSLGRHYWTTGAFPAARRVFHKALAVLVVADDARATEVRALLQTADGVALPSI